MYGRSNTNKYELNGRKQRDNKKPIFQAENSWLDQQKRDVYPQFSEPDEYSTLCGSSSKAVPTGSQKISEFPSRYEDQNMNPSQMTTNMSLPLFRQYVSANCSDDKIEEFCNDNDNLMNVSDGKNYNDNNLKNRKYSFRSRENSKDNVKKPQKELIGTRTRHLIGTVDQVIRWNKLAKDAEMDLHYDVAGILESKIKKDKKHLLLIRSESGHTLQGVFYPIDRELAEFKPGTKIIASGNMIGSNKLHIFDAIEIDHNELSSVQRLAFLSQRSLQETLYT